MKEGTTENPYIGLRTYEESQAAIFRGRKRATGELFRLVESNDVVVLYAESGEGKSSLLNAGLVPMLRSHRFFPVKISFTSSDFEDPAPDFDKIVFGRIEEAILLKNKEITGNLGLPEVPGVFGKENAVNNHICFSPLPIDGVSRSLESELCKNLWWLLRNYRLSAFGADLTPVLIFDQFEEVFSYPKNAAWTEHFFRWLAALLFDEIPASIVERLRKYSVGDAVFQRINRNKLFKALFSMRTEYMGELDYWALQRNFIPLMRGSRYSLKPLTVAEAKTVLDLGFSDRPALEERVLSALAGVDASKIKDPDDLPRISPMMLSVVCTALMENNKLKAVEEFLGGDDEALNGILLNTYDRLIKQCRIPALAQSLIEKALIDDDGRRVRIKSNVGNLRHIEFEKKYLSKLRDAGLIKVSKINEDNYVELVHDRLAKAISNRSARHERTSGIRRAFIGVLAISFLILYATFYINLKSNDVNDRPLTEDVSMDIYRVDTIDYSVAAITADEVHIKPYNGSRDLSSSSMSISGSANLKKVIIHPQRGYDVDTLKISLLNLPMLRTVEILGSMQNIHLTTNQSFELCLNNYSGTLSIEDASGTNRSSVYIQDNVENGRYLFSFNTIWDKEKKGIVYTNYPGYTYLPFPEAFNNLDSLTCGRNKFYNLNNTQLAQAIRNKNRLFGFNSTIYQGIIPLEDTDFGYIHNSFNNDDLLGVSFPSSSRRFNIDSSFNNLDNLKSISIPDSVERIVESFNNCLALSNVSLPDRSIFPDHSYLRSFKNCPNVEFVIRGAENNQGKHLRVVDNILIQDDTVFVISSGVNRHTYNSFNYIPGDSTYISHDGVLYKRKSPESSIYEVFDVPVSMLPKDNVGIKIKGSYVVPYLERKQLVNGKLRDAGLKHSGYIMIDNRRFTPKHLKVQPLGKLSSLKFALVPSGLESITLPNPQPSYIQEYQNGYKGRENLSIDIPDSIKRKVTLIVPWGCSKYYQTSEFKSFKEIKEDSLDQRVFDQIDFYVVFLSKLYIKHHPVLVCLVLLAILAIGALGFYLSRRGIIYGRRVSVGVSLVTACISMMILPLLFHAIYWFLYLHGFDIEDLPVKNTVSTITAIVVTAIIIGLIFFNGKWFPKFKEFNQRLSLRINR